MCDKQTTKKYRERNSPPYPANKCGLGDTMRGNDGKMYVVDVNKNEVHRWVLPGSSKRFKRIAAYKKKTPKKKTPKKKAAPKKKRVYVDNAMNRRLGRVGKSY